MQKAFQNFNSWAEEGNGAIASWFKSVGLLGLGRGYNCVFSDGGDITVVE